VTGSRSPGGGRKGVLGSGGYAEFAMISAHGAAIIRGTTWQWTTGTVAVEDSKTPQVLRDYVRTRISRPSAAAREIVEDAHGLTGRRVPASLCRDEVLTSAGKQLPSSSVIQGCHRLKGRRHPLAHWLRSERAEGTCGGRMPSPGRVVRYSLVTAAPTDQPVEESRSRACPADHECFGLRSRVVGRGPLRSDKRGMAPPGGAFTRPRTSWWAVGQSPQGDQRDPLP